jgi:hypothetical protein
LHRIRRRNQVLVGRRYQSHLALAILGVDRLNNPGALRRIIAASEAGARVTRGSTLSDEECDRRSARLAPLNLIRFAKANPARPPWTEAELVQLGSVPDDVLAERLSRTERAVCVMRNRLGIPTARDRRQRLR